MKKIIFATLLISPNLFAMNTSNDLQLKANISPGCNIKMDDIHLGAVPLLDTNKGIADANANIRDVKLDVECSKGVSYVISTPIAKGIPNPANSITKPKMKYMYAAYREEDPQENEYIAYRFIIPQSEDRGQNSRYFGDGTVNDMDYLSTTLVGTSTGIQKTFSFQIYYWAYYTTRSGNYSAQHQFNITY